MTEPTRVWEALGPSGRGEGVLVKHVKRNFQSWKMFWTVYFHVKNTLLCYRPTCTPQKKKLSIYTTDDFRTVGMPISFMCMSMRQISHPSVLPILQHAKDQTTVVARTQRLMFYGHRSHLLCKAKAFKSNKRIGTVEAYNFSLYARKFIQSGNFYKICHDRALSKRVKRWISCKCGGVNLCLGHI